MEVGEKADLNRWREVTLGDLIDIKHGYAFKGEFIHDEPVGDVLITPGNFAIGGGFQSGKTKYYSGTVPEDFVLAENDLLVTMTDLSKQADTLGYSALVPASQDGRRFLHNQRLGKIALRKTESADTRFLYYVLCSSEYRNEVLASATGTTVKHTSPERIKRYRFPLPSLPEQQAIAHVLGTLDDKIELNRRMNETLEAMARALFQSWFVDFEPVCAKMEGRWRPGESLPGLPAEHYHLFPATLVPSALGDIPEGWEVRTLGKVVEFAYGKALREQHRRPGTVPVYGSNGQIGWHDEQLVEGPGIVVGRKGNPGLVHWSYTNFFPIDTTFYVVPKHDELDVQFLYHELLRQDLSAIAADSAVPGLNRNLAYMNELVVPPSRVLTAFAGQVMGPDLRKQRLEQESRNLVGQRDTLLPRLMSGTLSSFL